MLDRIIVIKNNQDEIDVYGGMEISGGCSYEIDSEAALRNMQIDAHLHEDIMSTPADILIGDGTQFFTDRFMGQRWLMGWSPLDTEGRPYYRQVVTEPDFYYSPRSMDFYTSKYQSLYNRSHLGDPLDSVSGATIDGSFDLGDGHLHFYDASNTEIIKTEGETAEEFQSRLDDYCVKTVMEFEPSFDYDIVGAKIQFRDPPTDRAYFWVVAAPDIPKAYGGNVAFMGGGMNISFFSDRDLFTCDGKSVARISYDPVYHSGKLAFIVKHNVGVQIGIQFIAQFYSSPADAPGP